MPDCALAQHELRAAEDKSGAQLSWRGFYRFARVGRQVAAERGGQLSRLWRIHLRASIPLRPNIGRGQLEHLRAGAAAIFELHAKWRAAAGARLKGRREQRQMTLAERGGEAKPRH